MEILTHKGFKKFDGFIYQGKEETIKFTLSNGSEIESTKDHLFLNIENEFVTADKIEINDILYNNIKVIKKDYTNVEKKVYDALNVKDTHSYYTNGIISHNCLFCDEFAFVRKSIADEFWASNFPTLSASEESKVIIISTPNGLFNLFERLYTKATLGKNKFAHCKFNWRVIEGRDENWKLEQIDALGKQKFLQEHECVGGNSLVYIDNNESIKIGELYERLGRNKKRNIKILTPTGYKSFSYIRKQQKESIRIYFYEDVDPIDVSMNHVFLSNDKEIWCHSLKINDKLDHMVLEQVTVKKIEYLGVIDVYDLLDVNGEIYFTNGLKSHNCEFLGSTNTVIDSDTLEILIEKIKDPILYDLDKRLRIYEKPQSNSTYIMGTDQAKGTGEHDSTIQILKLISYSPFKCEQVAVFQDNYTDIYEFSQIIYKLALYYNNAYIMCENNAEGSTVVNKLWWDFEYENLINESQKSTGLGVRATTRTKPKAVLLMKKLIENGDLILNDIETVNQLTSFIDKGNGKFAGKDLPDDLVSALYWAVYFYEFDILDNELKLQDSVDEGGWGILMDIDEPDLIDEFGWMDDINL